ncbi:LysR family transcriptional regulator [Pseudoduganella eburnea]|uniref:LysR family transcriptional regulator n=1 Tax=Massilia eburnea TaxID=1776165 RepID=A0A6L6QF81_9BURK|nr:LysR family transcriptional regulator [Massilia eburnea]MTW10811.1 LysR family transcriptional regulator [Massilia eburnea]
MLDDLPALRAFACIVAAGSMSAAARELDLPLSVVSKRLAQLEKSAGVRLLQRTTRRQALTDDGAQFHAHVLRILEQVAQAESQLANSRGEVEGLLRLTAPTEFGRQHVAPIVADFQRQHPGLLVQLELGDTVVNLLESGHDMAIRFGSVPEPNLVVRRLAPNFRVVCAAPSYLERQGTPTQPAQLAGHRCIVIGDARRADWRFEGEQEVNVRVAASLLTNDGQAAHALALQGAGLVVKSIWDVGDDLLAGRLRRLLPQYRMAAAPLQAVLPSSRNLPLRVRLFLDYLQARLATAWRWDAFGGSDAEIPVGTAER